MFFVLYQVRVPSQLKQFWILKTSAGKKQKLKYALLKNTTNPKLSFFSGGFDLFRQNYPKHCTQGVQISTNIPLATNLNDDQMAFLNWEASKIQEKIYLGALHDAQNDRLLKRLGITHILNCCKTSSRNCEESKNGRYEYLQLCYDDNLKQSLDEKLEIAFNFIGKYS